jgi:Flp pilus assembly protein TadD
LPLRADQREFLSVLGHFYLQHGQVGKALTLLRASVVLAPDDLALLRMLSWAYLRAGDAGRALDTAGRYGAAGGDESDPSPIHLIRARALWQLGRHDEARRLFERFTGARRQVALPAIRPASP